VESPSKEENFVLENVLRLVSQNLELQKFAKIADKPIKPGFTEKMNPVFVLKNVKILLKVNDIICMARKINDGVMFLLPEIICRKNAKFAAEKSRKNGILTFII
jgi:hypothetical protein